MVAQTKKTTKKRNYPSLKINRENVEKLAKQGLNQSQIAKIEGVHFSTISRYLAQISPIKQALHQYNSGRADTLALSQLKKQVVEDMFYQQFIDSPEYFKSQDVRLQKEIVIGAQGGKHYDYLDERLERGQATSFTMQIHADIKELKGLQKQSTNSCNDLDD